ncbi:hypothetical protein FRB98_003256 [Tulasnella sp. 332]|nr:hypothetical protein FRB98_003256 [Tulasnella sp. 332]
MSSTQVERIALLSSRFEQLLLSGGSYDSEAPPTRLTPSVVRTLYIDPPAKLIDPLNMGTEPPASDVQMMRILPGGRFLVTGTQLGCVTIWDLGCDSAVTIERKPLGSIFLGGPVNSLHVQSHTPDSFILAMEYKTDINEDTMRSWVITEVTILGDKADLSRKAQIANIRAEGYALMEGEYIAVEHAGAIFLWNWVANTWGIIERYLMGMDPPEFDPQDQYRSTPHITKPYISIYEASINVVIVFKIPSDELQPASISSPSEPFHHPTSRMLKLTPHIMVPMPYHAIYTIPIRQWQPSLGLSSTPAFMAMTNNPSPTADMNAAAFILLHIMRTSALGGREMAVPARTSEIRLSNRADLLNAQALFSGNGRRVRVVTVWNADEGMTTISSEPPPAQVCLASDPLTESDEVMNVMMGGRPTARPVILTERLGPDARDRMAMSFCPLSGRVCMSIRPGEVIVMDYVGS